MINKRIRLTDDGSHTIYSSISGETYHSSFGAIQESSHIFIDAALNYKLHNERLERVNILEVGTGTGLNVILTYLNTRETKVEVRYDGYEAYPITVEESEVLNYSKVIGIDNGIFKLIHSDYNHEVMLSDDFRFNCLIQKIETAQLTDNHYDIVYFDAFSPESQPELWETNIFDALFKAMKKEGVLTTYSCKGIVKRSLKKVGFNIVKLPGPPGKREFLRAIKP